MAIIGAHALLYTSEPEQVRAIFRDVFGWSHVDAGEGWLIFALPPAEVGVHPSEGVTHGAAGHHALSVMCDDITATISDLRAKGLTVRGEGDDQGYGIMAMIELPGGLEMQLYQPRHPTAI
jgi:predicted enzyme related to lactoylglutathione lyase